MAKQHPPGNTRGKTPGRAPGTTPGKAGARKVGTSKAGAPKGGARKAGASVGGVAMSTSATRRTDALLAGGAGAATPVPASAPATKPAPGSASAKPAEAARHVYGPRPLGVLMPALTRAAFRRRSPAAAQLMSDWTDIVGPAVAAMAIPKRLVGTTLTLACSGPAALELQHLSTVLVERINTTLGRRVVEQLRFAQDGAPPPLPAPPARPVPVEISDMAEGELRDALARLGGAMAARRR